MKGINIFLNFNGNLKEAFDFYKDTFNGEYKIVKTYSEMAHADTLSSLDKEKIMHCELQIKEGITLMGCDILEAWGQSIELGNNFYINVSAENQEEGQLIFNRLSSGGEVQMPFQKTFFGTHMGTTTDRYGIQWMVKLD